MESSLQKLVDIEETADTKIRESLSNLPWPLWPRHQVYFMHKTTDPEGRLWILQSSIEYPKAQTDETVAVRGTLIVGAFIFEPHRIISSLADFTRSGDIL
eukprot:TRINITY_DN753_c0_g1_i13.p1 TRINITY_DN753_c0_g1~~TRINITY_DN753_c0_g1_i13.p1  ORF type:complete len:100 (-),score=5.34 TRINITY_DN753_c0_g1_i13:329-628(-)